MNRTNPPAGHIKILEWGSLYSVGEVGGEEHLRLNLLIQEETGARTPLSLLLPNRPEVGNLIGRLRACYTIARPAPRGLLDPYISEDS